MLFVAVGEALVGNICWMWADKSNNESFTKFLEMVMNALKPTVRGAVTAVLDNFSGHFCVESLRFCEEQERQIFLEHTPSHSPMLNGKSCSTAPSDLIHSVI